MRNDKPRRMPNVPPFVKFVCANVPMVFDDSLSYYEALCALWKYIQGMTDVINNNATLEEEYIEKFNELKTFVDEYFDNLDVQEEINNKLDQMAESGVLQDIILAYLNDTIKVIFPLYKVDGTDTNGDCTIVKTANNAIMVDCFINNADCYSGITEALYQNGISHLDYFILTHYHLDHYGNLSRLIVGNYITPDTTVILPRSVVNDHIVQTGSEIKQMLEDAGITWTEADNQTLTIDNATLNIYNGSAADYAYYDEEEVTDYNNYSLCVEVLFNDRKVLISGDCLKTACEYITPRYLSSNYDLIKDNHHSFCGYSSTYANTVNPNYVVCPTSIGMINANIGYRGSLIKAWAEMTKNIYVVGVQPETMVFTVGINGVIPNKKAIASIDFGSMATFDYYLDSTTTEERRDGSEQYPFKSLGEANALMSKHSGADVTLHVINIDNLDKEVRFSNYDRLTIDFDNQPIIRTLLFSNIPMLNISNLNLTSSFVKIENCIGKVTNITSSAAVTEQFIIQKSNIHLVGDLTSTNATDSFLFVDRSNLEPVLSSFTYTQASEDARAFKIYESNIALAPDTEEILSVYKPTSELTFLSQLRYFNNTDKICTLFTHTNEGNQDTIDLREVVTDFNGIEVHLKNNDGYYSVVKIPKNETKVIASFPLPSGGRDIIYFNLSTVVVDSNNKQMHLGRGCQFTISASGTTVQQSYNCTIMKVIGIPV